MRYFSRSDGKLFGCSPVCSAAWNASLSLINCAAVAFGAAPLAMLPSRSLT